MRRPSPINPDGPPIVRLVETLIHDAAARRAFEAVIDLRDGKVRVRLRIDREMHDRDAPPAALLEPVLARIKKLAAAKPTEQRELEGRFTISTKQCEGPVVVSVLLRENYARLRFQYDEPEES
jgi:type IV pilus assembly protein PilB